VDMNILVFNRTYSVVGSKPKKKESQCTTTLNYIFQEENDLKL